MARTVYAPVQTTRKPSGMTAHRDGMKLEYTWKVMDENHAAGQWFSWQTNISKKNNDKWYPVEVTPSDTSASVTLNAANYYPNTSKTLEYVSGIIRGKRSESSETAPGSGTTTITPYRVSEWTAYVFPVLLPNAPVLTEELDTQYYPKCTFSWDVETANDDSRPFHSVEWQTMRVKDCNVSDGSQLRWAADGSNAFTAGTSTSASGSKEIEEDSTSLGQASYTRWFRCRSRGPRGASAWQYIRHIYAKPWAPVIDKNRTKTFAQNGAGGTTKVRVEWTASWITSNPIDYVTVKWCIGTPGAGLTLPASPNWNDALNILDSRNTDIAEFVIDRRLEADQCLWVRVDAVHDVHTTPSAAVLVQCGELSAPQFDGEPTVDFTNSRVSLSVEHRSEVPDSRIALYFHNGTANPFICAIFDHDETTKANPIQLNWITDPDSIAFSIREFQGTASRQSRTYTVSGRSYTYNRYTITPNMESDLVEKDGDVPKAPSSVTARYITGAGSASSKGSDTAEVLVDWVWTWDGGTHAEVSWSENPNAWESTEPPETFLVERIRASQIYVSGLERGRRWYFRVRLVNVSDSASVYGPYSKTVSVLIAEVPAAPSTDSPSPATVTAPNAMAGSSTSLAKTDQWVLLNWQYVNEDGTAQRYADIREVSIAWDDTLNEQVITELAIRGRVYTPHRYWFRPSQFKDPAWTAGTTHYLQVRVTSTAGLQSDWSNPVAVSVANPVTCTISQTSLVSETVDGAPRLRLRELPMTVTVTGAGAGDTTTLVIERSYDYNITRPDESWFYGCEGETIVQMAHTGSGTFSINREDLIGTLDDYAWYRVIATVKDTFGQSKSARLGFQVHWDHQPVRPGGTVEMTDGEAIITPTVPAGTEVLEGDCFDIYRLSADRPQIIVEGGTFGQTYRDPYPAIGEMGGHRIVYRSLYGDYFTADSKVAWTDLRKSAGDHLASRQAIIDFDRYSVRVDYNIDVSNTWTKDFQETTYLGGSVQGDWNPAIRRRSVVNTVTVPVLDVEQLRNLRRLATFAGICHVRTPDGSSFTADVQVSESRSHTKGGAVAEFTLEITRVDSETLDGEEVS